MKQIKQEVNKMLDAIQQGSPEMYEQAMYILTQDNLRLHEENEKLFAQNEMLSILLEECHENLHDFDEMA